MGELFSDFPWREIPSCYRIPDYHKLGKCKVDEDKRGLEFELTPEGIKKLKTGSLWLQYADKAFEAAIDQTIRDRLMVFNTKVEKLNLYRPLRKDQIHSIWELFAAAYNLKDRPTAEVVPGEIDDNKDYEMDMMILGQLVTGAGHLTKKYEENDLIETLELLRNNLSSINTSDLFLTPGFLLDSLRDTHKRLMNSQGQKLLIGSWRKENVSLFKSKIVLPLHYEVDSLMNNLADWCSKNYGTIDPLIFAFEFHCRFIYIHPFSDGNGRVARLFMNLLLITSGFPPFLVTRQDKDQFCSSLQQGFWGNKAPYYTFMLGQMERSLSLFYQVLPEEPPHPPGIQCVLRHNYSADMLSECSNAIDMNRDGNEASPYLCSSYSSGDGSYQCRGMSVDKSYENMDDYLHSSRRQSFMKISSYGSLSDGLNFLGHRGMSIDHLGSLEE